MGHSLEDYSMFDIKFKVVPKMAAKTTVVTTNNQQLNKIKQEKEEYPFFFHLGNLKYIPMKAL